jgi:hypothetical protein
MLNDPILQSFLDEMVASEKTGRTDAAPMAAELEPFFDKLESGSSVLNVELFDAFREIACQQSSLVERVEACCDLLERTLYPKPLS